MIKVSFNSNGKYISGFSVSGHGTVDEFDNEGRIVCAAVSSAVYMTANTLTEIIGIEADISDDGDTFSLKLSDNRESTQAVLSGLKLHLSELAKDYKKSITINSEV